MPLLLAPFLPLNDQPSHPPPFTPAQGQCPFHREPPTPNPPSRLAASLSPSQPSQRASAPAPQSALLASPAPPIVALPQSALAPPRPSPPQHPPVPGSGGARSRRVGIRTPGPPRLRRVAEPGPVVSAASRLSRSPPRPRPPAGPPAAPRCRSEKDAPRVRAAAPAAASLQHRLTAASAPVSAPRTRALDHAALTDELRSQCESAEAASPAAPQAHAPRGTQASQPPGLRVLPRFSRSLTLAPGPPTRQTPNPTPVTSGNPGALASRPGIPHPPARGPRWQRPGLGRAEGEAVGPDLGARRSRSCLGGPGRSALCWQLLGAGPGCPEPRDAGCWGHFPALAWLPSPTAQRPPDRP